eukprot:TRINITY_DN63179_c0_g3_i1.p1 TRINITY_DN63179_c0_g3~~TRINITY_DN63179_c0_g3_i1.p1  ORF type:complete len:498 (-),score=30.15 TRINITY_DN63179_c0_g3_i1:8-1501(-)
MELVSNFARNKKEAWKQLQASDKAIKECEAQIAETLANGNETVDFSSYKFPIGDLGAALVASHVVKTPTVTKLNLAGNGIGHIGGIAVANALCRETTNVEWLDLTDNPIGDESILSLSDALSVNTKLRTLLLNNVGMSNTAAKFVVAGLVQNPASALTTLQAQHNGLTKDTAAALQEAVHKGSKAMLLSHLPQHAENSVGVSSLSMGVTIHDLDDVCISMKEHEEDSQHPKADQQNTTTTTTTPTSVTLDNDDISFIPLMMPDQTTTDLEGNEAKADEQESHTSKERRKSTDKKGKKRSTKKDDFVQSRLRAAQKKPFCTTAYPNTFNRKRHSEASDVDLSRELLHSTISVEHCNAIVDRLSAGKHKWEERQSKRLLEILEKERGPKQWKGRLTRAEHDDMIKRLHNHAPITKKRELERVEREMYKCPKPEDFNPPPTISKARLEDLIGHLYERDIIKRRVKAEGKRKMYAHWGFLAPVANLSFQFFRYPLQWGPER